MSVLSIPTAEVFEPLLAPARYKGAYGGRGSAKSHFFATLLVQRHIQDKVDAICLRETQKSLKFSVKKLVESKIQAMNAGWYFEVQDKQIRSRHGGITIFDGLQNHTAESIKSLEDFDIAWIEEAQTVSQRSLDILRPTMRKPGSEIWAGWNPRFATDPIDKLLRAKDLPPGAVVVEANYKDNPWFPGELRREMEWDRGHDPDKYSHIWLGQYEERSSARVFKNWRVEEFEAPADALHRQGADWGFSIDPSVLVRCHIVGHRLYVDYEAYMVGCEILDLPNLFDQIPDSRQWWTTADSARPETISHMKRHWSAKMGPAIKGARSLEEGVEFLQSFEIIVHPRCQHTIDELTLYRYKVDPDTDIVLPVLEDKDNHVIDALRYACEGARRARKRVKTLDYSEINKAIV